MMRRYLLWLAAALAACSPSRMAGPPLPLNVDQWRRTELKNLPLSAAPRIMASHRVKSISVATYEGAGKAQATVYEMASSAAGLDMAQRWRSAPDTVFFYRDQYFVTVQWEQADRRAVGVFVRALEKNFGPADSRGR